MIQVFAAYFSSATSPVGNDAPALGMAQILQQNSRVRHLKPHSSQIFLNAVLTLTLNGPSLGKKKYILRQPFACSYCGFYI